MSKTKYRMQNSQYVFPYHYLVDISNEVPSIKRSLDWGIEYLTYMGVVADEIRELKYSNILDVGCGDGYLLNSLQTDADKLGVDLSEKAIIFAQAFSKNTRFEVEDIFNIKEKFDVVSLIEVLEHVPDDALDVFVSQVLSLVNYNGYFIISVPTTVIPLNKKHYRHYDERLLDEHINDVGGVELVKEFRVYKNSLLLNALLKLLNNKFWSINIKSVWRCFWAWHKKYNIYGDEKNGLHIVRVYRKC